MDVRLPHEAQAPQPTDPAGCRPETSADSSLRITTTSVRRWARRRGWKLPITDGPFAESKEMLGG
jgi:hypothetical protein